MTTQKAFAPILIIIPVAFVLGIVATFLYFQLKPKPTTPSQATQTEQVSTPTTSPKASPQQATDETANWKTYTSSCGFSFKYPADYKVTYKQNVCEPESHQDATIKSPDEGQTLWINIQIDGTKKYKTFDEAINGFVGWPKQDQELTKIQGEPAVRAKLRENQQAGFNRGVSTGILILRNGTFYLFSVTGDESTINNFDQILSTFKFE
ncbi:MAG: hypothetical protein UR98_C0017G0020 [Parcubacteria group bacterium GW2011_GWA1_36_12]|nr:MAG: hypothetical protein UR98_C0017G0020 [Parcubacteria group bacterium GW2011_GWA1_36_12]